MTSRQRVLKAISFQEPDRVPVDLGGTRMTGMLGHAYLALRRRLGVAGGPPPLDFARDGLRLASGDPRLAEGPPRIVDVFQMLAEVEEPVRRRVGSDVIGLERLAPVFGLRNERWKPWRHFDGTEFLVPGDFRPEPDGEGGLLIRWAGDPHGEYCGHMPRDGLYFDSLGSTRPSQELPMPPVSQYRKSLARITDEELEWLSGRARQLHEGTDYAVMGAFLEGDMGSVGSYSDWMMILATEKEYARDILHAYTDNALANLALYLQAVGDAIDIVEVSASDYGTQQGPQFSPALFADLYAPCYRRLNDYVHQHTSLKTWYHCCGSIYALIPTFIEIGVDILNPVQTSAANMEPERLKREFGGKIAFWGGGVDTQRTLPFASPDEVREHVRQRLRILAPGGGFVFAAIHNIQSGVPAENLVAMYEAVAEYGRYPIA
jgi:uroporphyrinogen decarboxylase